MKAYAGGGVRLAGGIGGMPGGAQAFCASAKDMVSALARMEASAALRELCIVRRSCSPKNTLQPCGVE